MPSNDANGSTRPAVPPRRSGTPPWRGGRFECSRREFEETLDADAKERETLVMGLRLLQGVDVSSKGWKNLAEKFQWLEKQGLLVIDGRRIRLSEEALFVSDSVFAELV